VLLVRFLQLKSTFSWALSNLLALLRHGRPVFCRRIAFWDEAGQRELVFLTMVPTKVLILQSCLSDLKNNSICQRSL